MFRISHPDREAIVDVDQVEALEPATRSRERGRYHVDEIRTDPLPSGHTSRRWGIGIKRSDGKVPLDPDPWPDSAGGPERVQDRFWRVAGHRPMTQRPQRRTNQAFAWRLRSARLNSSGQRS